MTESVSDRDTAVQQIIKLAQNLYEALERQDHQHILIAQQNLSSVAERILVQMENERNLSARDKAILRLLAMAALNELPLKVQDPANYPEIKRDLRLLKSSLVLLPKTE